MKMPVFTANIPNALKVGDRIEIGGKIKENARKMSINLCAQEGEEPRDVVLHFDVRFHRDNIISLSRKNGVWIGSGNYDTNYNMFVPGTIFRIIFEIKDTDVITIYCQGKFHSNFLPKIPLGMAKYVVAWADVDRVTHCYFHLNNKVLPGDQPGAPGCFAPASPRPGLVAGDMKRRPRPFKPNAPPHSNSEDSTDDEPNSPKKNRAQKFFYETLRCSPESKYSPQNYRKTCNNLETSTEKSEGSTESSKIESSVVESEVLRDLGVKQRRGKLGHLAQVVNFMGKSRRS